MKWFEGEWNRPDRHDQYLMLIATEVRRSYAKHPGRVTFEQAHLKFVFDTVNEGHPGETEEQKRERLSAMSQARWFALTGYNGKRN